MLGRRYKSLVLMLLPVIALVLVACGSRNRDEAGGGGLAEGTPMVTEEVPGFPAQGEETPDVEEMPTVEITTSEAVTPTTEVTGTVEVVETPAAEMTEEPAEESSEEAPAMGAAGGQTVVVEASDLIGAGIEDNIGTEIGAIDEVLVDETGAIQYVVVDAVLGPEVDLEESVDEAEDAVDDVEDAVDDVEDAVDDEEDTVDDDPETTDTTQSTQTDDVVEPGLVVIPWDALELKADDADLDVTTGTEEITGTTEITGTEAGEEPDRVILVYAGDTSLEAEPEFDEEILKEQGYVLDEQEADADEMAVPSEYLGLLQVSDYGDYEVQNMEGEELGSGDELLIDLTKGQVAYLVIDVGGFLGIGAKSVPIPWNSLQLEVTDDDGTEAEVFRLDATADRLEEAPEIELGDWTPQVEPSWDIDFLEFWETGGAGAAD